VKIKNNQQLWRNVQHVFPLNTFKTELTTRLTAYEIEDFLCVFHDERGKKEFTVLK